MDLLITSFQRLIIKIANQFHNIDSLDFMDLIQAGNEGLLRAIKKFNITRNIKFIQYAYPIIYHSIIDSISRESKLIPISRYYKNKAKNTQNIVLTKLQNSNNEDKESEISNDYPRSVLPTPIQYALKQERKNIILKYLDTLKPDGKNMIILYFGLFGIDSHTYEQIGQIYQISKSAVYQYISKQLGLLTNISEYFTEYRK